MSEKPKKTVGQKEAEAEVEGFREDLGPFVVAAETTRMAMVFSDAGAAGNPIIFANDAFLHLTGYAREEVLGQPFNFILAHRADADALAKIESEFHSDADGSPEVLYRRKDGTEFWAALFINSVRDEAGNVVQHFASFVDLTKHREEEAKSRMLIDELNHRVKNTLSTVQSIVWQALRTLTDPKVIQGAIESRLHALSRSHDLLTRENWKSAGLHDLIEDALAPFGTTNGRAERIVINGPNIRFPPPSALALSIAFNELATNAVKYGALSNETGSILIEWTVEAAPAGNRLVLHWRESNGPKLVLPATKGFGSRVIESGLSHELGGNVELDYQADGLVCSMNFPVPEGA
jgi:PAS domain S-box-containing protein